MAITPIDPHTLSSLEHEYDAREITGLSNADPVDQWDDTGPGGAHATESGATRPEYRTNVLNGLPGVFFDGSDLLSSAAETVTDRATRTVIIVGRKTTNAGGSHHTALTLATGTSNGISCIFRDRVNQALWTASNSWRITTDSAGGGAVVDDDYIWAWTWDAADECWVHRDRVDGAAPGSTGALPSHDRVVLGSFAAGGNHLFRGYLFHVLVFDSVLPRPTREGVEAWLANIWDPDRAYRYTYEPSEAENTGSRDFGSDTLDEDPPGTTNRYASQTWPVKEEASASEGRWVEQVSSSGVRYALSFDAAGSIKDVEARTHVQIAGSGTGRSAGLKLRGAGDDTNTTGLAVVLEAGRDVIVREWDAGSTRTRTYSYGGPADQLLGLAARAEGEVLYARWWDPDTESEPTEWMAALDVPNVVTAGWVGLRSFRGDHGWGDFEWAASLAAPTAIEGTLAADLQPLTAALTGTVEAPPQEVDATLAADLQALESNLSGTVTAPAAEVEGTLAADLQPLTSDLSGTVSAPAQEVEGALDADLQALTASLSGTVSAAPEPEPEPDPPPATLVFGIWDPSEEQWTPLPAAAVDPLPRPAPAARRRWSGDVSTDRVVTSTATLDRPLGWRCRLVMTYTEADSTRALLQAPGYPAFGGLMVDGHHRCAITTPVSRDAGQLLGEPLTSLEFTIRARETFDA